MSIFICMEEAMLVFTLAKELSVSSDKGLLEDRNPKVKAK